MTTKYEVDWLDPKQVKERFDKTPNSQSYGQRSIRYNAIGIALEQFVRAIANANLAYAPEAVEVARILVEVLDE